MRNKADVLNISDTWLRRIFKKVLRREHYKIQREMISCASKKKQLGKEMQRAADNVFHWKPLATRHNFEIAFEE